MCVCDVVFVEKCRHRQREVGRRKEGGEEGRKDWGVCSFCVGAVCRSRVYSVLCVGVGGTDNLEILDFLHGV